ncbi:MAG: hypothetical protein KDK37_09055 [Leptospiraceae bacterium]|nr:hypothetical protein [Leptospiraceae bacterium]MCB1304414.1 hypothetical protein [Leptospiraceae bacterium]
MSSSKEDRTGSRILSVLAPIAAEVIPIFWQRWQQSQGIAAMETLQRENEELQNRVDQLEQRVRWMQYFLVALAVFFTVFLALFVLRG